MKRKNEKNSTVLTFFGVPLANLVLVAVVFSNIGWIVENLARIYFAGCIDARFYVLPFISAYGIVPFVFQACLRSPDDIRFFGMKNKLSDIRKGRLLTNFIAFVFMAAFVFVAELAVGNLWDALFGVQLWDYTAHPLKVTRYAGLFPSLAFGLGAFLLYKTVYKWLLAAFAKRPYKRCKIFAWIFGTLIILDTIGMILYMAIFGEEPMLWKIQIRT